MPLTPSPSPGGRGEQPSLLRNTTMYVRLFAAVWLLVCAFLAVVAWGFQAPFSYDPVGPRAYPLLLLSLNLPVDDPTVTKSVVAEPVEASKRP